jgi:putative PIN family toxin of toxin-antitoxin system
LVQRRLTLKRLVFDTNVVVSALLFTHGRLAWLRAKWQSRRLVPLVSNATAAELLRVLSYAKFKLSKSEREELLGDYLPFTEVVEVSPGHQLPRSNDGHDQMFIDLVAAGRAEALASGDPHLLEMADVRPFDVMTPAELGRRLGRE